MAGAIGLDAIIRGRFAKKVRCHARSRRTFRHVENATGVFPAASAIRRGFDGSERRVPSLTVRPNARGSILGATYQERGGYNVGKFDE